MIRWQRLAAGSYTADVDGRQVTIRSMGRRGPDGWKATTERGTLVGRAGTLRDCKQQVARMAEAAAVFAYEVPCLADCG